VLSGPQGQTGARAHPAPRFWRPLCRCGGTIPCARDPFHPAWVGRGPCV